MHEILDDDIAGVGVQAVTLKVTRERNWLNFPMLVSCHNRWHVTSSHISSTRMYAIPGHYRIRLFQIDIRNRILSLLNFDVLADTCKL